MWSLGTICVVIALAPSVVWAATYPYTARTIAPVNKQGAVSADGVQWKCGASQCTTFASWPTPSAAACRALAMQVGRISSYGHAKKMLNAAELNQCNAGIGSALPQTIPGNRVSLMPVPDSRPPASAPSGKPPATRSGPATFTSLPLTVTGTGALTARGAFSPRSFASVGLAATGTGALAERAPFSPKTFTANGLTVTGTGALR